MIARTWRGWARADSAERYQRHCETEVTWHLRQVPGFLGARLLSCRDRDEVKFTSITFFSGMDDVRAFAGDDPGQGVVEEAARRALARWAERVVHHEVAADIGP